MAKEELIMEAAEKLLVFDKHNVGDLTASWGIWKTGVSAVNNSYKSLCNLVDLKKLEKADGYFRIPGCKSEFKGHSQILTKTLVQVLKIYPDSLIAREKNIPEVSLRPDALILIRKQEKGLCLWLEVCNYERPEYFQMKVNALKSWNALPYLSKLFNYQIPSYRLIRDAELKVEEL